MVYPSNITLNLNTRYVLPIPTAQQGDTARVLTFNILDNGVPFSLVGKSVRAKIIKPDGTKVFNGLTITNATNGECNLALTNQVLAVVGIVKCQLEITEGQDILSTIIFNIEVRESIDVTGAVESSNEFTALQNGLTKLDEWDKYFHETSGAIEEKYTTRLNAVESSLEESKLQIDKLNNIIVELPIERFGGVGDGVSDNSQALSDGIDYVNNLPLSVGTRVFITLNNGIYKFNSQISKIGKNVFLKGEGTIINNVEGDFLFNFTNEVNEIKNVTSISDNIINCDTTGLKKGDILRLFSDDFYGGNRYNSRKGEYITINKIIDENSFSTIVSPYFSYKTNIRVSQLGDKTVHIEGLKFDCSDTIVNRNYIQTIGMKYPVINNTECLKGTNTFINLIGNYKPFLNLINVTNLEDDGESKLGYGIAEIGSYCGRLGNSTFDKVRHFFMTGSTNLTDTPYHYGETLFFEVYDCIGNSATTAGFDTHENGFNITFSNCKDYSSKIGFQARSNGVRFINCESYGTIGFNIFNYSGTSNAKNIELSGCKAQNREKNLIIQSLDSSPVVGTVKLKGCDFESKGDNNILISSGELLIEGSKLITTNDVSIVIRSCNVILSGNNYIESKTYFAMLYGLSELKSDGLLTYKPLSGETPYLIRSADGVTNKKFIFGDINVLNNNFNPSLSANIGNKDKFSKVICGLLKNYERVEASL